jgi:hypothetical protein
VARVQEKKLRGPVLELFLGLHLVDAASCHREREREREREITHIDARTHRPHTHAERKREGQIT